MTSLWDTFNDVADRVPDVEAILSPGRRSLRFADLPGRLEAVRQQLAAFGIGRRDRVVSILPRGPETAVCFLGVAACSTYVPLNPEFSETEFETLLTRLRPSAVIVPEHGGEPGRHVALRLGISLIELASRATETAGTFSLRLVGEPRSPREPEWNGAEDYALILLTSGSTASPKLVPLRVRHLLAYARQCGEHYGLGPADRGIHLMPMFHGHGLKSGLLCTLANGSGLVISPDVDVATFFQLMKTFRPTWYTAAASIHQAILTAIPAHAAIARDANLRFIRSGSTRLDPKVMAGLEEAFGAPMLERYGGSETCTLAANPLPPGRRKAGSVGLPAGNEIALIDAAGNPVAPGIAGEVVARGPSVFDGYLDDDAANSAAFINGWFRTGDLGRFDEDGYLVLTGRIKDVINRGGEKIGIAEVEAALLRHPLVTEVCVFAIPHPSLGEEVAAAVSTKRPVSERELQAYARGFLTHVKVPRRIFFLASLPKGASNKIRRSDTAALCLGRLAKERADGKVSAPRALSAIERDIAAIWSELLEIDTIEPTDDFFLIGGDSLKAYELFARLRRAYGVVIGLGHIFEDAATVEGMARLIERARQGRSETSGPQGLVMIKSEGTRPPLFAVPGSGGNPVGFIHLGRLLDGRQPLIGIEARGLDGLQEPLTRMEDIAADNVARIRAVQPHGPYFLIGSCFGGRVAYEMARQLEGAGERIGLLLMLDASAPFIGADGRRRGAGRASRTSRRRMLFKWVSRRIGRNLRELGTLRGRGWRSFAHQKLVTLREMLKHRDLFGGDPSHFLHRTVYEANRLAGQSYVPGCLDGPAALFLTRDRAQTGTRNYRLEWLDLVPQIGAPIYVAGQSSGEMLSLPHVYELAEIVNRHLEAACADDAEDFGQPRCAAS